MTDQNNKGKKKYSFSKKTIYTILTVLVVIAFGAGRLYNKSKKEDAAKHRVETVKKNKKQHHKKEAQPIDILMGSWQRRGKTAFNDDSLKVYENIVFSNKNKNSAKFEYKREEYDRKGNLLGSASATGWAKIEGKLNDFKITYKINGDYNVELQRDPALNDLNYRRTVDRYKSHVKRNGLKDVTIKDDSITGHTIRLHLLPKKIFRKK